MSTDPNALNFLNGPGISSISLAFKEEVDVFPEIDYGTHRITDAVELETDAVWHTDLYFTPYTANLVEEQQDGNGDDFWKVLIECFHPRHDHAAVYYLTTLENHRFIIDCTDKDGNRRLVGTQQQPLRLVQKYQTGKKPGEIKGTVLRFAAELSIRPPFYAPDDASASGSASGS